MNRSHALVVALSVVSLTGCAASPDGQEPEGPVEFGHVHGLGINPADERLYVASHLGVFRQTDDGFELVADRQQDTMAFTVTGPDTFLASGHPDLRETDKPVGATPEALDITTDVWHVATTVGLFTTTDQGHLVTRGEPAQGVCETAASSDNIAAWR